MNTTLSLRGSARGDVLMLALAFFFALDYGVVCVRHGSWSDAKAIAQKGAANPEKQGTDFTAYYSAGELAREHKQIYDWRASSTPRRPFIYPPMFALFPMLPLSLLPHDAALGVFYALNVLALFTSLWLLRKLLWPDADDPPFWRAPAFGIFAALAVTWRFIHANTIVGNANLLIFFLLVVALYFDWRSAQIKIRAAESRPFQIISGFAVALAAAFKLTPGLFGIFFLWSWRRWAMLGGALGLAAFMLLLPALWFGWETNLKYLRAFAHNAAGKAGGAVADIGQPDADGITIGWGRPADGKKIKHDNPDDETADAPADEKYPAGEGSSLRGALTNLLTPAAALKVRGGAQNRSVNILALEPAQARWAANLCALALLVLTAALTFKARASNAGTSIALCWSLVACTMVLVAPLTRIAHLVVLILPVLTLIALLQQRLLAGSAKTLAWCALIFLSAGCALVSGLARSLRIFEILQAAGFTTLALLLLYAAVAAALLNTHHDP